MDTHETLFFFSNRGRVYKQRAFEVRGDMSRTSRGIPLVNLIPLSNGEQVQAMLAIANPAEDYLLVLATKMGEIKALKTGQLANIRSNGLMAMDLETDDELVSAAQVGDAKDIVMVSEMGQAIRFPVEKLTPRSRSAGGVRGLKLLEGDRVIAMSPCLPASHLVIVSRNGYGKSTPMSGYPRHSRGGQGVRTFKVTAKTGPVASARVVSNAAGQEMFVISAKGHVIRVTLADFRVVGRNTQGVIIWRDREVDDFVASFACFQDQKRPNGNGNGSHNGRHSANGAGAADLLEDD